MKEIQIFTPATIANISCGFDVLGCCLEGVGDVMMVRKSIEKGIRIGRITGEILPLETEKNVAGVAGMALLGKLKSNLDFGFEIEIEKRIKPGSGIGSSAASAAGAVYAINALLDHPFDSYDLINFAREGERLACGSPIADNVAPALLGGFTLVKSADPLKVLKLPTLNDLYVIILHPQIEIKTSDSRNILPKNFPLTDAVKQWANVGSLVHALHTDDYELFADSLHDFIVEPYRSKLIPGFHEVQQTALEHGALGSGISGSGPSIFAFCHGSDHAEKVKQAMDLLYKNQKIPYKLYLSKINPTGIKILTTK